MFKTENIETGGVVATKFEKREQEAWKSLLVREIKILMDMKACVGKLVSHD